MVRSIKWLAPAIVGLTAQHAEAQIEERSQTVQGSGRAQQASVSCDGPLDLVAAVRCALGRSPEVREARDELAAIAGRRVAAAVWLPSNPVVGATVARRRAGDEAGTPRGPVLNWSATLSQELEVGGQRGIRLQVVDAEARGQIRRVAVAEQDVAAQALSAYFEAVAAREALRLSEELVETGRLLAGAAEARARESLLSGVDADVARAEAARLGLLRFEAERRSAVARASLGLVTGGLTTVDVVGALEPPLWADEVSLSSAADLEVDALRLRGEIAAAEMERRVLDQQVALLRRERIPNVTVSGFVQRDAFAEHVAGVGISVPLPLPAPLGRTRAGDIEAASARARAGESSVAVVRRRVRLQVAAALAGYRARQGTLALYAEPLLSRARADLVALREAMTSRQLGLREGIIVQRSLIELLAGSIEARLGYAEASVEIRRVVGRSLIPRPGGER
jgi:cobalt-zinc-cadmium efflux system outer membrane protein